MALPHATSASVRVMGDDLDLDEISSLLGVRPHISCRKGDANGRFAPRRTGVWSRVEKAAPADLDRQIREVLAPLTDDLEIWSELARRFDSDVFCGVFFNQGNAGFALQPQTLKLLADRQLKIDFDLYSGH